jgi:hypothetical protein
MLTDRAVNPPAWPLEPRGQAFRSSESAIAAEVFMDHVG